MKQNEWNEGLNNLDSDIIENYVVQKEAYSKKRKKPLVWTKYIAVAACLCLVFGVTALLLILNREDDPTIPADDLPNVPIFDTPQYSAADIAGLINRKDDSIATNAYTKVYVPNEKYLYIDPLPTDEYIGIYKCNTQSYKLDQTEFENFLSPILSKMENYLDKKVSKYEIERDYYYVNAKQKYCFDAWISMEDCLVGATQRQDYQTFFISGNSEARGEIFLDGEKIQINQQHSNDEIIASLESVKNKLFDIFGVSFSDTKVVRRYDDYSKYGVTSIKVYFYNSDGSLLDKMSDFISLSFDNFENWKGDAVSATVLSDVTVRYTKSRGDSGLELQSKVKMITLDEAEELLYKGYVFGGHSCELCMQMQDEVSFEGYDCVDIEYQYDDDGAPTIAIPFYAFYKNIGTAKNGNTIYAKTLVCAIELSGYDEYFESQIKKHSSGVEFGTIGVPTEIVTEAKIEELTTEETVTEEIITDEISSDSFIVEEIVTEDISS